LRGPGWRHRAERDQQQQNVGLGERESKLGFIAVQAQFKNKRLGELGKRRDGCRVGRISRGAPVGEGGEQADSNRNLSPLKPY